MNQPVITPPTDKELKEGAIEADRIHDKIYSELRIIEDLEKGIEMAKIEQKPIALMFTGYGAINSRKLEHFVIVRKDKIFTALKDKYINVWLYVDSRTKLNDSLENNNG
ncbi:MAG: hypothetical protein GY936_14215, partial [Ignavibacteriae bacterium]|nr:hypothetical protein [Ignavibacteriota bacterium]